MNVTLIGMSGVGKSFIGEKLAAQLAYDFIDIDERLHDKYNKPVQHILDEIGDEAFVQAERDEVMAIADVGHSVIAPGGSIIYSPEAMTILKKISTVIYLVAPSVWIEAHTDPRSRGVVGMTGSTFAQVYAEREPLYAQIADYTVSVPDKTPEQIVDEITGFLTSIE